MAEIINLRQARKGKKRAAKEDQAATNRAKFGRTKQEKKRDALVEAQKTKLLDGAKLDTSNDPEK